MIKNLGRLQKEKTVFMLCDIQMVFQPLIYQMGSVSLSAEVLTQVSGILDVPLIVTEHNPKVFGSTLPSISCHFQSSQEVTSKTKFNKHQLSGKQVVLFGIEAHVCIQQTCLDLLQLGCDVHLVEDAISSQNQQDRHTALKRLTQAGAYLDTTESIIFELLGDSKHEKFKQILPLIKMKRERI